MKNINALKDLLQQSKHIVIVSHRNPDGDALGSSMGLAVFLRKLGHQVQVIMPSEYPSVLNWMPGISDTLIYDQQADKSLEAVARAELAFCLDFNTIDRIDKLGEAIVAKDIPIAQIDHHIGPGEFADFLYSDTSASSTSEMIYLFIQMLEMLHLMDREIGSLLYTGIITDTGSFKFATSARLFRVVADLVDLGVNDYLLQDMIHNNQSEKHLRLLGHCLLNRMQLFDEYRTGLIALNRKDFIRYDIQRGDTEGIVNYMLKIPNIVMAGFITAQPNIVKLSLRSKGDFSVQQIASAHFNGGGHRNASGGYSHKGFRVTVQQFIDVLPQYKEELLGVDMASELSETVK